jgi:sterol 3beta-glucosyltransferase
MRVLMLAPGSRGDATPAASLGARLRAAGHDVVLVADARFAELAQDAGCAFRPIPADLPEPEAGPDGAPRSGRSALRALLRKLADYFELTATAALAAAADADAVLANAAAPFGRDIAEGIGATAIGTYLQPLEPSAAYPPVLIPVRSLGGLGNRLAGTAVQSFPAPYDAACARIRRELGLSARSRRPTDRRYRRAGWPVHHGISSVVLPRPGDWRAGLHLDGYWWPLRPPGWVPAADLTAFLAAGTAPVVIDFGSTITRPAVREAAIAAARQAGQRVIVQSAAGPGGGQPAAPAGDDQVLRAGFVPHDWLLPQATAVIHHAGAGTTAAALRAAVPSVTVPGHTDQPFWGGRVAALGAGAPPVRAAAATPDRLAAALAVALSPTCRDGARQVAVRLAGEDGGAGVLAELDRRAVRGTAGG